MIVTEIKSPASAMRFSTFDEYGNLWRDGQCYKFIERKVVSLNENSITFQDVYAPASPIKEATK